MRLKDENNREITSLIMENEKRNKTLSQVLIVLGIIMSIGGLIGLIGGFANMWNLHELDAKDWLFGTIIGGFNIWILGILIGRKLPQNPSCRVSHWPFGHILWQRCHAVWKPEFEQTVHLHALWLLGRRHCFPEPNSKRAVS